MFASNSPDLAEIFERISTEGMRKIDGVYSGLETIRRIARGNRSRLAGAFPPRVEPDELKPVLELSISSTPEGAFIVQIDRGKRFSIPPLLGALLRILAADTGKTSDDLVGWKTFDAIVAAMRASGASKKFTRHALSQAVLRLRKILIRHDQDPRLIQTNRSSRSYRFAIRRTLPDRAIVPAHSSATCAPGCPHR